ncbi:lytic transglycosylase domain-containing protein, partial [Frankia canadensis]|uniref:lytic transglycosylase domain-containing protein n=1 Tax=Frankia canadensis TaxID=1836972 RepID=UPI001FAF4268
MIAAIPMTIVLALGCVAAGVVPHPATATVAGAGASTPDVPAGTVAHPPTHDYDVDLPPLIPAVRPTPSGSAGPSPSPTASPNAGSPGSGPTTGSSGAGANTGGSPSVVLRAADRQIPGRMLLAYHRAESRLSTERPRCHLRWQLLAGIGRVESGHARGRAVTPDGTLTSRILGPALDGHDGRALIRDTDHGRFDGDLRFDRAVGAMQFIPSTWRTSGRDGSGDGRADPNNIDDATLAAGGYLCHGGRDLAVTADLHAAIYSYNPSASYLRAVLAWAAGYTTSGVLSGPTILAAPHPPAHPLVTLPAHDAAPHSTPSQTPTPTHSAPGSGPDRDPDAEPTATPTPAGTPAPAPRPSRSPSPTAPTGYPAEYRASGTPRPRVAASTAANPAASPVAATPSEPLLVISMTPTDGTGSPRG